MNRGMVRGFAVLLIAVMTVVMLQGCARYENEREGFHMDTFVRITVYDDKDQSQALDKAMALCRHYDRLFGRDTSGSDVWRINHAQGSPTQVSDETAELILLGLEYSKRSGGLFDITCGAVTEQWDFSAVEPTVPDEQSLLDAVQTVGWQQVVVEENSVTVPSGVKLDLGGIAKGYIADKIAQSLRENGVESAVIDLGGNIYALGSKNGKPFSIAVQSPYAQSEYIAVLEVNDKSVVTAGKYERCFELDGKSYHHILDLKTGMPTENDVSAVTILSESSAQGDALSTTCLLLGKEKAVELIEKTDGAEAIIAMTNGDVVYTSGASQWLNN